jgi:heat shock protein HtpX
MDGIEKIPKAFGGFEVSKEETPFYYKLVEECCKKVQMKRPKLYVIPDEEANAFTTGSRDSALIATTTGLLEILNEDELEAVISHEIGHIQFGDVQEKTKVALKALPAIAAGTIASTLLITSDIDFTPWDDDSDDWLSLGLKVFAGLAIAGLTKYATEKWSMKTSYKCEYRADEFAGELSKKPWALASALEKIEKKLSMNKKLPAEIAQLFIVSPVSELSRAKGSSTHPPTTSRIQELLNQYRVGKHYIPKNESLQSVPTFFCSICGMKTDSDGSYCMYCGSDVF